MRRWRALTALAALIFSLGAGGCLNVQAMKPVAETPCVVTAPKPMPPLPEVVSVRAKDCPYALCLDQANFAKLKTKLAILKSR